LVLTILRGTAAAVGSSARGYAVMMGWLVRACDKARM
jgi:hypothetical protein